MKVTNSDFWILAGILSTIGGVGVWEGYELNPAFYSQSAILFGGIGYFGYKTFHPVRKIPQSPASSENLHSN